MVAEPRCVVAKIGSSSLTDDFAFFGSGNARAKQAVTKRSVDEWRHEFQGKPVETANEMIVADGSEEAYEAFVGLYAQPPFGPQARLSLRPFEVLLLEVVPAGRSPSVSRALPNAPMPKRSASFSASRTPNSPQLGRT